MIGIRREIKSRNWRKPPLPSPSPPQAAEREAGFHVAGAGEMA
jgi:hypothetical protein